VDAIAGKELDSSDKSWAFSIRGEAFGMMGQHEKAIEDCLAAIEADEQEPYARYVCGTNFYALGDNERAVEYLNASLEAGLEFFSALEANRLLDEISG
jgi:tetratricopeptide (TPR) repeat protein